MNRTPYISGLHTFVAVAAAALALPAFAAPIVITNGSFEKPDVINLTDGYPSNQDAAGGSQSAWQYTEQTATSPNKPHYYGPNNINDPIPYWSVVSTNNPGLVYGISNPISTNMYPGTSGGTGGGYTLTDDTDYSFNTLAALNSSYGYGYADGYQLAYANLAPGGSVSLTYNASDPNAGDPPDTGKSLGNFVVGDSYTLTVAVGTPQSGNGYSYGYSIVILDNGVPVATSSGSSPATASGDWLEASVPYIAADDGAIGIELLASNSNASATIANFDNVQLNDSGPAPAPPAPEPASLSLLAVGFIPLRRRRA